ncbi:MAG TPA: dockerin type I domain-containing protein, partial [Lacipirellulaceae bacterium]|nr:dockerin type I domain-containing protein [Lacipirellulaceae bacterium]
VQLLGPAGELLQSFVYDDSPPWPTTPDGGGYSLEIIDPLGDPANSANWRASYYLGGSPGFDGLPPTATPGDFNGDDLVDGADFLAWQRGLGTLAPHATRADGDADGDGDVDADDLALWQVNFGPAFAAAAALWHDAEDDQPSAPLPTEPWILVAEPPQRIHRPAFRPRAVDEALSRFSGRPAAQLDPAPASGPSRPTVENPSSPPESIDPVLADAAAFALAPPR